MTEAPRGSQGDEEFQAPIAKPGKKRGPSKIARYLREHRGVIKSHASVAIVAGTLAVVGSRAFTQKVDSAPATISGTVDSEPVLIPGVDEILPNGMRVKVEPGVKVILKVCKGSQSLDVASGTETHNNDCTDRTGFLTVTEINQSKVKTPLAVGMNVKFDSSDFFSGANVELDR